MSNLQYKFSSDPNAVPYDLVHVVALIAELEPENAFVQKDSLVKDMDSLDFGKLGDVFFRKLYN